MSSEFNLVHILILLWFAKIFLAVPKVRPNKKDFQNISTCILIFTPLITSLGKIGFSGCNPEVQTLLQTHIWMASVNYGVYGNYGHIAIVAILGRQHFQCTQRAKKNFGSSYTQMEWDKLSCQFIPDFCFPLFHALFYSISKYFTTI